MKVGETLPDYFIDLEGVPDSLKWNIAQNIQDQLQSSIKFRRIKFYRLIIKFSWIKHSQILLEPILS